jgi:hypothetical protein
MVRKKSDLNLTTLFFFSFLFKRGRQREGIGISIWPPHFWKFLQVGFFILFHDTRRVSGNVPSRYNRRCLINELQWFLCHVEKPLGLGLTSMGPVYPKPTSWGPYSH